jgi:hypothetical protein
MKASDQMHDLTTLTLEEETPVPTGQKAGWTLELVQIMWRSEKSLSPPGTDTQPIP